MCALLITSRGASGWEFPEGNVIEEFFSENAFAPGTMAQYRGILSRFLEAVEPASATAADVLKWLDSTGWGNSRRYVASVVIRRYLRWRFGAGHPALRLRVRREKSKPGRTLSENQVMMLFESFDTSTRKGRRDLAIAALALDTGLRVAELARLRLADVDLDSQTLTVQIKGGRWASAVFSVWTAVQIAAWLPYRAPRDPRLFQVTRDGLRVIVRRWGERLGFRLSPHDFRRTFAVFALRNGAPSRVVQRAGRWSDIRMVERYSQAIMLEDFAPYFPVARIFDV